MTKPMPVEGLRALTERAGAPQMVRPGTLFVVSHVIVDACPERSDLLVPYDLVRDQVGHVVGCRALARIATDPRR